jgi:macrolide-specific efflux system membrane fusion protein
MFHFGHTQQASAASGAATSGALEVPAATHWQARLRHKIMMPASVALLIILGGAAVWWFYLKPQTPPVPQTVAVTRGDIQLTVLATGIIEANQLVSVGAQESGRIDKLDVKLGDVVKQRTVLAEIDSLDQQRAVDFANSALTLVQAQLTSQQATLATAQNNLDRYNQMQKVGVVSNADYDTALESQATAKAQISVINAQITQATLNVATAQLNLTRTKITAPIAGTIVSLLVDDGQNVNAVQSSPTIVKLADLSTMIIKAQISEADEPHVKSGQLVYFTILGDPDTRINAKLLSIDPAPDSIATESDTTTPTTTAAIYYNGLFAVPNPDGKLKIDMTAQVTIVLQAATGVLLTPSAAIQTSTSGKQSWVAVYDPQSGATSKRSVTVGIDNNVMAEIKSGLVSGDLVVTDAVAPSQAARQARPAGGQGAGRLGGAPLGL